MEAGAAVVPYRLAVNQMHQKDRKGGPGPVGRLSSPGYPQGVRSRRGPLHEKHRARMHQCTTPENRRNGWMEQMQMVLTLNLPPPVEKNAPKAAFLRAEVPSRVGRSRIRMSSTNQKETNQWPSQKESPRW